METSLQKTSLHTWNTLVFSGASEIFSSPRRRNAKIGYFRYLNNPELLSGTSFLGLALISGSKLVGALAVLRFLSNWWFLRTVEKYVLFDCSRPEMMTLIIHWK